MYHKRGKRHLVSGSLRKQQIPQGPDRSSMSGTALGWAAAWSPEQTTQQSFCRAYPRRQGGAYPRRQGGTGAAGKRVRPDGAVSTTEQAAFSSPSKRP